MALALGGALGARAESRLDALVRQAEALFERAPAEEPARRSMPAEATASATALLNEIKARAPEIDPAQLALLQGYLVRPEDLSGRIDTQHFRIHYAPGGPDQPAGWPSMQFLEHVAQACEPIYTLSHGEYGWGYPPGDGEAGGDGRIDVYLRDLGWGVFGYTLHEDVSGARGHAGFIVLDNDFAGLGGGEPAAAARVTLAHEYQHLIQVGYGYAPEANWFMEQIATMMEGHLVPELRDRESFLPYCLQRPHRRLDLSDGSFEYGAWLWPEFLLAWSRSTSILPEIWGLWSDGGRTMRAAVDEGLRSRGSSLDDAFLEWALWNGCLQASGAAPVYGYTRGYAAAVTPAFTLSQYPVSGAGPAMTLQPEPLGVGYVELRPAAGSADNALEITLEACGSSAEARLIQWHPGNGYTLTPIPLDDGWGGCIARRWDETTRALLVLVNGSQGTACCSYRVSATTTFRPASVDEDSPGAAGLTLSASPNPFEPYTVIQFQLPEAMPVALRLYDAQGRLAGTLLDAVCSAGRHAVRWSALAEGAGASGLYFCEIRTPLGAERLRLLHVR